MHRYLNLALLVLYPVSWAAPLMRAGLLPLFGLSEISIVSGLAQLLRSDIFLALIVSLFAILAPMLKTLLLALVHFGRPRAWMKPAASLLGRLAMADIFLIALYLTVAKGVGVGQVETAWGLYLFSFCVLASLYVSWQTDRDMHED